MLDKYEMYDDKDVQRFITAFGEDHFVDVPNITLQIQIKQAQNSKSKNLDKLIGMEAYVDLDCFQVDLNMQQQQKNDDIFEDVELSIFNNSNVNNIAQDTL